MLGKTISSFLAVIFELYDISRKTFCGLNVLPMPSRSTHLDFWKKPERLGINHCSGVWKEVFPPSLTIWSGVALSAHPVGSRAEPQLQMEPSNLDMWPLMLTVNCFLNWFVNYRTRPTIWSLKQLRLASCLQLNSERLQIVYLILGNIFSKIPLLKIYMSLE